MIGETEHMDEIEEFKHRALHDAYQALILHMYADAWAMGYEAARSDVEGMAKDERGIIDRDHPLLPAALRLREEPYSDLRRRASREVVERNAKSEREMLSALATLGPTFGQSSVR